MFLSCEFIIKTTNAWECEKKFILYYLILQKKRKRRSQENTEYNLKFSQLIFLLTDFFSLNVTRLSISGSDTEKDMTEI